jgi:hypothetical protein
VVALTLTGPLETTHWSNAAITEAAGISVSSVQRIWRSHGLQPHRMRQFKLSNELQFAAEVRDIIDLYVDPPAHAVRAGHWRVGIVGRLEAGRLVPAFALPDGTTGEGRVRL